MRSLRSHKHVCHDGFGETSKKVIFDHFYPLFGGSKKGRKMAIFGVFPKIMIAPIWTIFSGKTGFRLLTYGYSSEVWIPKNSVFSCFLTLFGGASKTAVFTCTYTTLKKWHFLSSTCSLKNHFSLSHSKIERHLPVFWGGVPPHPPFKNRFVATSNFGPRALSIVWFGDILWKVDMGSIKNPYI